MEKITKSDAIGLVIIVLIMTYFFVTDPGSGTENIDCIRDGIGMICE